MASGIKASDEAVNEMNVMCKSGQKRVYNYLIMSIKDQQIQIEKQQRADEQADLHAAFEEFSAYMVAQKEPRFGLVELPHPGPGGQEVSQVVFIHWSPEDSSIRTKMLYASSAESFKNSLPSSVKVKVQSTDASEIQKDYVVGRL